MKNKFNTLREFILDNSVKKYRKETVDGLFRSIVEPLLSNQKLEACILVKLNDITGKESVLKRLSFCNYSIFGYNDGLSIINAENVQIDNIWDTTEFLVVLGQRYSAALIWDYDLSGNSEYTDVCLLYNSKIISDIARKISANSKTDLKEYIQKYSPDRRENSVLNQSVSAIAALLNDKIEETIFNENEKKNMSCADDTLETAGAVTKKAKFIAHEIKNNLSIVNLYSTIAEKRLKTINIDTEIKRSMHNALKNIATASENMSYLIADLRCLSAPFFTEVNIRHVILNTVMMCSEKAEKAGVTICTGDFSDFIITADKTKFQCALTNIIFNAIEACEKSCTIWVNCIQENNFLKVYVKNNGAMIPDNIKDRIFEPEFTTKPKGSGLGLDICRKQLQLTGGNIKLVSSNEKETVFVISLPV